MIRLSSKSVVIFASYNFETRDLRAVFSKLDMLTYQFYLLSKPNSPIFYTIPFFITIAVCTNSVQKYSIFSDFPAP
jgi:hypothetical protein